MSLQALPDFQQPIIIESLLLYYPYEANGPFRVLPHQLIIGTTNLAATDETQLDFQLTFVRGQFPNRPPEPHGRLAFGLQPHFDLMTALDAARQMHPTATVAPVHLISGSLRLVALNEMAEIPPELLVPTTLQWAGAEALQVQFTMSATAATFVRDALLGELLLLSAYVELDIQGVAPRLPVQVTLDPHQLLDELYTLADGERRLPRTEIVRYVLRYFDSLLPAFPFTITGALTAEEQMIFGETLTDHLITRFGHFVPTLEIQQGAYVQLEPWMDDIEAEFHWDLSNPLSVTRRIGLSLDPFAAAQQVIQAHGLEALYKERIVPALPTGLHQIYVSTNFPAALKDVITTGIRIRVPPQPPYRYHEIVQELETLEQSDEQTTQLRLSFRESLGYFYATFLVIDGANGEQTLRGEERWHDQITLRLTAADYPVQLATVAVTPQLTALAEVNGSYRWREAETHYETHFTFGNNRQLTLLLPQSAEEPELSLRATRRATATTLLLTNLPFQDTRIGCYSFPGYGSHTIEITCVFAVAGISEPVDLIAVELLPEGLTDTAENRTTIHFTPDQSRKQWSWFADSPFAGGYRYRLQRAPQAEMGAWSAVQSPFVPLTIEIGASDMEGQIPGDQRLDDLLYYADPTDLERFFYIPGKPLPVLNPQARPMLSLLIAGSSSFLQLDVRWHTPTAALDALRQAILKQHPTINPAMLRLSFAPVTINQITLLLTTAQDNDERRAKHEIVLATSQSSGTPPYNGLFSVALTADQQDLVIAALHEQEGILHVRYEVTRTVTVTATVIIEGDVQGAFRELTAASTLDQCRNWVRTALTQTRLQQVRSGSPLVSTALWQRAEAEAVEQAAQWLYRHVQRLPTEPPLIRFSNLSSQMEADLAITAALSETLTIPLLRTADISTWFSDGSGDDHIRVVG